MTMAMIIRLWWPFFGSRNNWVTVF